MQCNEIQKKLDAWLGNEVSARDFEEIKQHLGQCTECSREAEAVKQLSACLEKLHDIAVPGYLTRKTRLAFQRELMRPGMAEWWKSLSFFMQSAVCGVILTGLLCGAVLCNSIIRTGDDTTSDPYQTLYASRDILL